MIQKRNDPLGVKQQSLSQTGAYNHIRKIYMSFTYLVVKYNHTSIHTDLDRFDTNKHIHNVHEMKGEIVIQYKGR